MNRIKRKTLSFRYKLLIGFLTAAILPILISGIVTVFASSSTLNTQAQNRAETLSDSILEYVDGTFVSYIDIAKKISINSMVSEGLLGLSLEGDSAVYLELYRLTESARQGAVYCVYDTEGNIKYSTNAIGIPQTMMTYWGVLGGAGDANGECVFYGSEANEYGIAASLACAIYDDSDVKIGYVTVHIYSSAFSSVSSMLGPEDTLIITDNSGYVVYSTSNLSPSDNELLRRHLSSEGISLWDNSGSTLNLLKQSESTGAYILLSQNAPMSGAAMRVVIAVSAVVMAICILLGIVVSTLISRQLALPIGRLSFAMKKVRGGDLQTRVIVSADDEIGELGESFNAMTADLDRHIKESVKRQQDLNDTQIRLLQTQLNPHFLYNTLDTIKWVSKLHNAPEAASLAANLAIILRQSIKNAPFVTVASELAMLRSYIDIQQIRFSDKFNYVVDVPAELEPCLIPKLILQPLVENAIIHGLENCESGTVTVSAREEDGKLILAVSDDGCGMPEEYVERINSHDGKIVEGHLGIYNVFQIIKLNYGDGYGMRAESSEGAGSTITLTLPKEIGGDGDIDKSRGR